MMWKCGVCGYLHEGKDAPERCPKCGAPKQKFSKLDDGAEKLVVRSRKTNDIHMAVEKKLAKIIGYAEEGIKDDLDPNCVLIFERLKKDATEIRQAIKAELEAHMKKGKWG